MVHITLVPMCNLLYFYISTFYVCVCVCVCARTVPNLAVFCSYVISCFPVMLLRRFLNYFEIVSVIPVITGTMFVYYISHALCVFYKVF
jgi:hypothetical protein